MGQSYIKRGSPKAFVELIKNNWDNFINGMKKDSCPNKIELKPRQYLKDVLDDIAKLMQKLPEKIVKVK